MFMMSLKVVQKVNVWASSLRRIYSLPATITVVTGEWKTGKTDFALHIVEELYRLKLISKAASNIKTFQTHKHEKEENEIFKYIDDLFTLKHWLFKHGRKAYVYDEAIVSTPSRRAMSKINTAWLRVIPELSKARCQLIVIAQEMDYMEKSFLHETFIRAMWEKISLPRAHPQFRKMVKLYSKLIPEIRVFKNIPKCNVHFDPYRSATFKLQPELDMQKVPEEILLARDYANGMSSVQIRRQYTWIHSRTQAIRRIKEGIKQLWNCYNVQMLGDGIKAKN